MPSSEQSVVLDRGLDRTRWMLRLLGVRGTVSAVASALSRRIFGNGDETQMEQRDQAFDRRFGVTTVGHVAVDEMDVDENERKDMVEYRPMPTHDLAAALTALPIDRSQFHLVDLGCGMGRVLVVGSIVGFDAATGVELSASLASIAEQNISHIQSRFPETTCRVLNLNAGEFEFPTSPLVVFLFNPFGRPVVSRVVDRLEQSLADHTRDCWILYANAVHSDVFDEGPAWKARSESGWWRAFKWSSSEASVQKSESGKQ